MTNISQLKIDHNRDLEIEGIVVNQFNPRARLPREVIEELIEEDYPILETYLSSSVKMKESHRKQKPLPFFAPRHKLTIEFADLYDLLETD
jgi:chromosome partitioning protein